MAVRGRKPKPTAVHEANGNPSEKRLRVAEPKPASDLQVTPPGWLQPEARRVWDGVVPILMSMGVMQPGDENAVGRYCDAIVMWQRAMVFLHERGSTYPIRSKDPVVKKLADGTTETVYPVTSIAQYPQVAEYRQLSKLLLNFEAEFGLTASARTRVEVFGGAPSRGNDPESRARRSFFAAGGPGEGADAMPLVG